MIRIIESVKDYVSEKYWNFVMYREINTKDPNYFGEVSDKIAEELFDFFNELIADEINETESWADDSDLSIADETTSTDSWVSDRRLKANFRNHCVGSKNKKSDRRNIRYDFTSTDELKEYGEKIISKVLRLNFDFDSLCTPEIALALSNLKKMPMSVIFDIPCGFENDYGSFKIGLNSFANDVTTNFPTANTINVLIISKANNTISMFPVDSDYIGDLIKILICKYTRDKGIKKLYKKLKALQQTEINENT